MDAYYSELLNKTDLSGIIQTVVDGNELCVTEQRVITDESTDMTAKWHKDCQVDFLP